MNELVEDVLQRWMQAIDEIAIPRERKEMITSFKYAASSRFDLGGYERSAFRAGGVLLDHKPDDGIDYYTYGLNAAGLPVYVSFEHSWNKTHWEGFYNYTDDVVEYIEFRLETNIPSCIQVIRYDNDKKISFQHFSLNGRGSGTALLNGEKAMFIEMIKSDPASIISNIESYVYEADEITKAKCFSLSPGVEPFQFEKKYTYDNQGEQTEIRAFYADGNTQLQYVSVPEHLNVPELIERLAVIMAEAIVDALLKQDVEQPLFLLELNYRHVDNYVPNIKPRSLAVKEEAIAQLEGSDVFDELFTAGYEDLFAIEAATFERPLQQLLQWMNENDDFDPGTVLLRETASLLTVNKLYHQLRVTPDFLAYAIDWGMEGGEIEEILIACGQTPEIIEDWKAKEWL